uniref:Uncharacterized protein n=1 Tax=Setaria viridis TaxID=4556 RepID=A0A4U6TPG2_SETVI|nr:hypothetical protein SEVIR_8G041400v2 [Setaria viridis]
MRTSTSSNTHHTRTMHSRQPGGESTSCAACSASARAATRAREGGERGSGAPEAAAAAAGGSWRYVGPRLEALRVVPASSTAGPAGLARTTALAPRDPPAAKSTSHRPQIVADSRSVGHGMGGDEGAAGRGSSPSMVAPVIGGRKDGGGVGRGRVAMEAALKLQPSGWLSR